MGTETYSLALSFLNNTYQSNEQGKKIWKELSEMKKAGQTYNQLIKELIQKANRLELAEKAKKVKNMDEDELSFVDIDE